MNQSSNVADDAWLRFVSATTSQEFCNAWLAILCQQLGNVISAVVLLEAGDANTFLPSAAWPAPTQDMARLGQVAERALTEARGVVVREQKTPGAPTQIAYPIQASKRVLGAVALEIRTAGDATAELRQIHWGIGWLRDLLQARELAEAGARATRIGSVMEALATSLRAIPLQQTLFEIANHVARHLACSRVAIGLAHGQSIRLAALSDAAWFERSSAMVRRFSAAMEEALDQRALVNYVRDETAAAASNGSPHAALAQDTGASAVVTVPLLLGSVCVGAMTLERATPTPFSEDDLAWIEALAGLLPAVVEQKRRAERGYLGRLRDDSRKLLERLFGPHHFVWKFGTVALLTTIAALNLIEIGYRVTAKTVIEGEVQRAAVAPFEGFVGATYVRAGDAVREGQALCELDTRDLKIEQAKWNSEREQADKKLRKAMADRDFPNVQIETAQLKQADAQLALANERIRRAKIVAPFDGVVVSGDLSQLIGSPVEQGKKLFEIAPLASYRVILRVDEKEIRDVSVGQHGRLVIAGIAGEPTPFEVIKVTPVANAEEGTNFFRVEALLHEAPPRLRPGMEGVGKIEVGERRLWWVLTHSFTNWLRLQLWSWMP